MLQDLLPVRRAIVPPEVWLELSTEYFECCALPDTVCTDKSKHLPGSGCWQSVELEAVGRIAVSDLSLQVGGQIDDVNGAERALLGTDTAADTEAFGDEGDLGLGGNLNTELASPHDRT